VRILVACEFSSVVRDPFRARGHDAWSCDLLPTEGDPQYHIQGDVLEVLDQGWDLMIAHPPCTYLSRAGARWRTPERMEKAREALGFVLALWNAPVPRVVIENPIGLLKPWWRPPDQVIEPWYFGERFTKRTWLWFRGVPPLMATTVHPGATPWVQSNTGWRRRMGLPRAHVPPGCCRDGRPVGRSPRGSGRMKALLLVTAFLLALLWARPAHAQEGYTAQDTLDAIDQYSVEQGVSRAFLLRIVRCETGGTYDPYSVGRQGELGPVQLHPRGRLLHFFSLGYDDPFSPYQSVRYLAQEISYGRASAWSCAR